ncbi:MAG: virulence protein [Gemmatimonadetes bacterium]|nr:virulence protein [Gemmatimonadota bacterium]
MLQTVLRRPPLRAAAAALLAALATRSVARADLVQPGTAVGTLPLIEVPARARVPGDLLVVLLSADGGWAKLDRDVAARLSAEGIPVVGWNSLSYYSHRRSPDEAAAALGSVLRHYLPAWRRERVLLVGYSFGADVLPLMVNRLPPDLRARVAGVALLAFSGDAEFQFHLGHWVGKVVGPRYATLPQVRRLRALPILCVHGQGDGSSVCERIGTPNVTVFVTRGGHSLGSASGVVSALLLRQVAQLSGHPAPPPDGGALIPPAPTRAADARCPAAPADAGEGRRTVEQTPLRADRPQ